MAPRALPRCRESDVGWTPEKTRRAVLMMGQSWHASPNGFLGALIPGLLQRPARENPPFGDRQLAAASAQEGDEPRVHGDNTISAPDEVIEVQTQPSEPGEEPAELDLADLADRAEPRDRRHAAFV